MIVSNRFVRTYLFGSKVAIIHNKSFECCVSTAKEGWFQKQSTIILEAKIGNTVGAGPAGLRPCGKVIYSPALRKDDRLQFHDTLAKMLDALGEEGCTLEEALEQIFTEWKRRAIAAETVNLAADQDQADDDTQQDADRAEAWFKEGKELWRQRRHAEATACIRPAAEQGHAAAQYLLSYLYHSGQGVPQDDMQAAAWLRNAAERGLVAAQCDLGVKYAEGQGVPQDYTQAALWYRKAAEQGYAQAQYKLGDLYDTGRGVQQDYTQAALWYRKAAEQGIAAAQHMLGDLYHHGQGVPQDYTQVTFWWRKAAELGFAPAQYNLGLLYDKGQGVPQDYAQAALWYRRAAEKGVADAQCTLGAWYGMGQGVPQDYAEAYFWSDVATAGELDASMAEAATKNRDLALSHLTPADLSREQERARKWFEAHQAKKPK